MKRRNLNLLIFNSMRFLHVGRNDITCVWLTNVGDMRYWKNDQSLVVCKQNMVTSTEAERSQRIERNKRMRLLDYARSDRKDGKAVLDFFTRMRFLRVGRNDIACVKLLIVGDMEL